MRSYCAIAVATILIAGLGVTLSSFPPPIAQGIAHPAISPSSDASQASGASRLPIQKMHDMSVVFSRED
jgi:hypothetical protein